MDGWMDRLHISTPQGHHQAIFKNQVMLESWVHSWDPTTRTFYIYLCKYCWDPNNVRSFL